MLLSFILSVLLSFCLSFLILKKSLIYHVSHKLLTWIELKDVCFSLFICCFCTLCCQSYCLRSYHWISCGLWTVGLFLRRGIILLFLLSLGLNGADFPSPLSGRLFFNSKFFINSFDLILEINGNRGLLYITHICLGRHVSINLQFKFQLGSQIVSSKKFITIRIRKKFYFIDLLFMLFVFAKMLTHLIQYKMPGLLKKNQSCSI